MNKRLEALRRMHEQDEGVWVRNYFHEKHHAASTSNIVCEMKIPDKLSLYKLGIIQNERKQDGVLHTQLLGVWVLEEPLMLAVGSGPAELMRFDCTHYNTCGEQVTTPVIRIQSDIGRIFIEGRTTLQTK